LPNKLPAIMAAYRMTPHSTTGVTPNYAMVAWEVRLPCSLIATPPEETQNLIRIISTFVIICGQLSNACEMLRTDHQKLKNHTSMRE